MQHRLIFVLVNCRMGENRCRDRPGALSTARQHDHRITTGALIPFSSLQKSRTLFMPRDASPAGMGTQVETCSRTVLASRGVLARDGQRVVQAHRAAAGAAGPGASHLRMRAPARLSPRARSRCRCTTWRAWPSSCGHQSRLRGPRLRPSTDPNGRNAISIGGPRWVPIVRCCSGGEVLACARGQRGTRDESSFPETRA